MNKIFSFMSKTYVFIFARPAFEKLNDRILGLALKARGYNHHKSYKDSGEQFFIEVVMRKLAPKICVDVGANTGTYTNSLLCSTDTTIYSFEPLAQPYKELMKVKDKFGDRLIATNKGVGAKDEVLTIHFSNEETTHASFSEEVKDVSYVENNLSEEIEVITLDAFFAGKLEGTEIDLIKIDTEGFEYEVICGAKNVIEQLKPKMIQIEYNWHQLFKGQTLFSFSQMLTGYQVFQMLPNRLVKRDPKDPYVNIYNFSNFVFIRDDVVDII